MMVFVSYSSTPQPTMRTCMLDLGFVTMGESAQSRCGFVCCCTEQVTDKLKFNKIGPTIGLHSVIEGVTGWLTGWPVS